MADVVEIVAPSGLAVTMREFKVTEENLATTPKIVREGKPKTRLLEAVTIAVEDPGPYVLGAGDFLDWEKVLHGDREAVLRDLRVLTWGPDYYRDDPCPACEEATDNCFDLSAFPVKELPAASLDHVRPGGKALEIVLPRSGKKLSFRLLRGADEKAISKIYHQREDERVSGFLALRTVAIEGVDPRDHEDWIKDLGGMDSSFFKAMADEADCGIDQAAVWKCDCGHRWTRDANFGAGFFFPKYRAKRGLKTRLPSSPPSTGAPAST